VRPATTSEPIGGTPVDDALDDAALAEKLKAAGYDTAEKVSAASDDELRAIPGVGPASVAKIRAAQASA
jgi:DNA uptake protein ComE-like DNA-binding protein